MNLIIAIIIGILCAASVFLMFQKSFFKLIIGVILFGYATIFFIFTLGGVIKEAPPLLGSTELQVQEVADPLPQALTLTAIVISIGVQLFMIVLFKKVHEDLNTEDLDDLNTTDCIED